MNHTRHDPVILYADVEGFTAMVHRNGKQAVELCHHYRRELEQLAPLFDGKVLRHMGDRSIASFPDPERALGCAIRLQQQLRQGSTKVPLRIGIHSGEIIETETDVFGKGVLLAARIESIGTAGCILISSNLKDRLGEPPTVRLQSLGFFLFEESDRPLEVFAVDAPGTVVPDLDTHPRSRSRKTAKATPLFREREEPSSPGSWIDQLWQRGVLQLLAGYFVASWTVVEFVDWLLERYEFSPYWTDILLVLFACMTPSVILFLLHRERISRGELSIGEKVFFPANTIVALGLVFFLYSDTPLGTMTKMVTWTDEFGQKQERQVVKGHFKKKIGLFPFRQTPPDSVSGWLSIGIATAISSDLLQDQYILVSDYGQHGGINQEMIKQGIFPVADMPLSEKLNIAANDNLPLLLTGSYSFSGDTLVIHTDLYEVNRGEVLQSHTYRGLDFFVLADQISRDVRQDIGITPTLANHSRDLPLGDIFTHKLDAYRNFTFSTFFQGTSQEDVGNALYYMDKAMEIDSTFAVCSALKAALIFRLKLGEEAARQAIDRAMRHRYRLPERWQLYIQGHYYRIYTDEEKALAFYDMQSCLYEDSEFLAGLAFLHFERGEWKKYLESVEKIKKIDPAGIGLEPAHITGLILTGKLEEAEEEVREAAARFPKWSYFPRMLSHILLKQGRLDEAERICRQSELIEPGPFVQKFAANQLKTIEWIRNNRFDAKLLEPYLGTYRFENKGLQTVHLRMLENQLFAYYPDNIVILMEIAQTDPLQLIGSDGAVVWEFEKNEQGEVLCFKDFYYAEGINPLPSIVWKQDGRIPEAEQLLKEGKAEAARILFQQAYDRHPEHYYLRNYLQHLDYLFGDSYGSDQTSFYRYAGPYGSASIRVENNQLYFKDLGIPMRRMLPLSFDRFMFSDQYTDQIRIEMKDGDVTGITLISREGKQTYYSHGPVKHAE